MHLADGIVPVSHALVGFVGGGLLTAVSLHRIRRLADPQALVPRAALVGAVFFAVTLISIPAPPVSMHLVLCALTGILLGWFAVPVIVVGLFFQAILFGHGGLTTLGLNALILGVPALIACGVWRLAGRQNRSNLLLGFTLGAGGVLIAVALFVTVVLAGLPIHLDAQTERQALTLLVIAYLPLAVIEGIVTAATLGFLQRAGAGLLRHD